MSLPDKKTFKLILNLQQDQPWIVSCSEAMNNLLFSECRVKGHQNLVIDLIRRFKYLSHKEYIQVLTELTEDIVTEPSLSDNNTQIVAMAADSKPDSSQELLYHLKLLLPKMGWVNHKQVNRFGLAYQTYKKSSEHKNIVLIDEFVGTGGTVLGRVEEIQRVFKDKEILDYSIQVKVLIATDIGLKAVKAEGISISTVSTIEKGISDYYPKVSVNKMLSLMYEIEALLLRSYKGKDLPSLGHGKTESLYCRENANTPNSVFPIFWWPFYENGDERITMLVRSMGDA